MTDIKNIHNLADQSKNIEKTEAARKKSVKHKKTAETTETGKIHKDDVKISAAAKELLTLRAEAKKYVEQVKNTRTLTDQEVVELKQKIESKYYFKKDVIDKIVGKLLDLPNYIDKKDP